MNFSGLYIFEPKVFGDEHGSLIEVWNDTDYAKCGLHEHFVQDHVLVSRKGVLKGIHYQNPAAQGKLVSVLQGEVFDVAVDLRIDSITFGQWFGLTLSSENRRQLYIPGGFGHGFLVTSYSAVFHCKCTNYNFPQHERSLRWDDPDLSIDWPMKSRVISGKDRKAPDHETWLDTLVGDFGSAGVSKRIIRAFTRQKFGSGEWSQQVLCYRQGRI